MSDPNWWAAGPGQGTCKKCGEDRLIDETADSRGIRRHCAVCCHSWWIAGPLTAEEYRARLWPLKSA